jgi:hypothetical protein
LAFLTAFDADFAEHGVDVIRQLRLKDPVRYSELAGRLITAAQDPSDPSNFSVCDTEQDIARKLLHQVGVSEDAVTPHMLDQAQAANSELLERLLTIAEGN